MNESTSGHRMRPLVRVLRPGALLGALALLAIGCGGGEDPAAPAAANAPAPGEPAAQTASEGAAPAPVQAEVCGGYRFTCLLRAAGDVLCSGLNASGQLGDGTGRESRAFVAVSGIADAIDLGCGKGHACAVLRSGEVRCWGENTDGQLGNGGSASTLVPVAVAGISDAVQVEGGSAFSCARRRGGEVSCWGEGSRGNLGSGAREDSPSPVQVAMLDDAIDISLGSNFACAARESGEAVCWGAGSSGQLGRGEGGDRDSERPVPALGLEGVTRIAAGTSHVCAIAGEQTFCWGNNRSKQLGQGEEAEPPEALAPIEVAAAAGLRAISSGDAQTCGIKADGTGICWGSSTLGRAYVRDAPRHSPGAIDDLANLTSLMVQGNHGCALQEGTNLLCWGFNMHGEHAMDDVSNSAKSAPRLCAEDIAAIEPAPSSVPTFAPGAATEEAIRGHLAFGESHACGVLADGRVRCFGSNSRGQLGIGNTAAQPSDGGLAVVGISDAVQVAAALSRTCVRRRGGEVACFGDYWNSAAELELGASLPQPIAGITDATDLIMGGDVSCVRHADGGYSCWGSNFSGQLGNGGTESDATPSRVSIGEELEGLALAGTTSCAIRAGKALCWGSGSNGLLGDEELRRSLEPMEIPRLSGVTQLSGYGGTMCAIHRGGKVSCWGSNSRGLLGQEDRDGKSAIPVEIRGIRNAEELRIGKSTACAIVRGGEAFCWGANGAGQTGHGETEPTYVTTAWNVLHPEGSPAAAFGPYAMMGCGDGFCCGLHQSGEISCQGNTPLRGETGLFGLGGRRSASPIPAAGISLPAIAAE